MLITPYSSKEVSNAVLLQFLLAIFLVVVLHFYYNNENWKNATEHIVKQYNQEHPLLEKIKVDDMTPEKLEKITNPCTIFDWRERNKCNK